MHSTFRVWVLQWSRICFRLYVLIKIFCCFRLVWIFAWKPGLPFVRNLLLPDSFFLFFLLSLLSKWRGFIKQQYQYSKWAAKCLFNCVSVSHIHYLYSERGEREAKKHNDEEMSQLSQRHFNSCTLHTQAVIKWLKIKISDTRLVYFIAVTGIVATLSLLQRLCVNHCLFLLAQLLALLFFNEIPSWMRTNRSSFIYYLKYY